MVWNVTVFFPSSFHIFVRESACWSTNQNTVSCELNGLPRRWAVGLLCCGYGGSKAPKVVQSILQCAEGCSCGWGWAQDNVGVFLVTSFSHVGQGNDSLSSLQVWDLVSCSGCVRWCSSFSVVFKHVLSSKGNPYLGAFMNQGYPAYFYSYKVNWWDSL